MRQSGIDPIILDAGDLFFSTKKLTPINKESEYYRAGAVLEGYNKIGCDAINVGQYELLGGLSFLRTMAQKTDIPFVSANLRDSKTLKLVFEPYRIFNRGELEIGVIGLTDKVPDTSKSVVSEDYLEIGKKYIDDLREQVDIVIVLVNSDRKTYEKLPKEFEKADFILTSGSTFLTRPNNPQKEGGPYLYSLGKQGKYLHVLSLDLQDSNQNFVNMSIHQNKVKSVERRFDKLQKQDPGKPLEEIYADQKNVLSLIEKYKTELAEANAAMESAVNTFKYETIALSKKIRDDPNLLAFVDESLAACSSLKNQKVNMDKPKGFKKKRKKNSKKPNKS